MRRVISETTIFSLSLSLTLLFFYLFRSASLLPTVIILLLNGYYFRFSITLHANVSIGLVAHVKAPPPFAVSAPTTAPLRWTDVGRRTRSRTVTKNGRPRGREAREKKARRRYDMNDRIVTIDTTTKKYRT